VVKKGKTPVLTAEEARELLDSIAIVRNTGRSKAASQEPSLVGLRDRALIAVMVYSFARVNAVLEMKVEDYFVQGRRGWVRLHEKGGKEHEVPCHHNLDKYLDEYIAAARIAGIRTGLSSAPPPARPASSPATPCGSRMPIA
jgi:integrase/recombinase XerD